MTDVRLIVNADDLGWTPGVNDGIFTAHLDGIVSSATLMVNGLGAEHAAAALADSRLDSLGVGLHVALSGGGRPTLPPDEIPSLVDEEGRLPRRPEGLESARPDEIRAEVRAQLARFAELVGRPPTHLDGHHHVHFRRLDVFEAVLEVALGAELPVRPVSGEMRGRLRQAGVATPDTFDESFYAEGVTATWLTRFLRGLPPGLHELMCHPGRVDDELRRSSSYVEDREIELALLTDPACRRLVASQNVELVTYGAL